MAKHDEPLIDDPVKAACALSIKICGDQSLAFDIILLQRKVREYEKKKL